MTYDPSVVSYEQLLDTFWGHIDPTQANGQGGDQGTQYRSGIYTHTPEQLELAMESRHNQQKGIDVKGVQVTVYCCGTTSTDYMCSLTQSHGMLHTQGRTARPVLYQKTLTVMLTASTCMPQVPIATEVEEVRNYSAAEEYHQGYLSKGGRFGNAQNPTKGCSDPIRCYG